MRSKYPSFLPALLALAVGVQAQSLGEIARQQQQKKNLQPDSAKTAATAKKVYTNEDMPKSSSPSLSSSPSASTSDKSKAKKPATSALQRPGDEEKISADELKEKIQEQKDAIVALQQEIEKLQSTVNYVQNNRNIYTNAPEYNDYQKQKQQAIAQMKAEVEERKSTLKDLQEQARQAGLGNAVYD